MRGTSHSFLRLGATGTGAHPQPGTLKRPREQDKRGWGNGASLSRFIRARRVLQKTAIVRSAWALPPGGGGEGLLQQFSRPRLGGVSAWSLELRERTPTMGSPKSRPRSMRKVVCGETRDSASRATLLPATSVLPDIPASLGPGMRTLSRACSRENN